MVIALVSVVMGAGLCLLLTHRSAAPTEQASGVGAPGGLLAEQYASWILYNGGYNSALPITTSDTVTAASGVFTSSWTLGSSGTALSRVNQGSCVILAYSNTISASSTVRVDCGSTGQVGGTLTAITSGDNVFVHSTTTLSSVYGGVRIVSSDASSTAGYVTLNLFNETGTTFTWSGAASTTIKYWVIR